jgi:hypothetical protein
MAIVRSVVGKRKGISGVERGTREGNGEVNMIKVYENVIFKPFILYNYYALIKI